MGTERDELIGFLKTIVKPGGDIETVEDDVNLFDAGYLDSLAIIQIIMHLEQAHSVNLAALGIDPRELGTIKGILDAIDKAG